MELQSLYCIYRSLDDYQYFVVMTKEAQKLETPASTPDVELTERVSTYCFRTCILH